MSDYIKIGDSIAETMKKAGAPLSEDQKILLIGCLSVYLQKEYRAGMLAAADIAESNADSVADYPGIVNQISEAIREAANETA